MLPGLTCDLTAPMKMSRAMELRMMDILLQGHSVHLERKQNTRNKYVTTT